MISSVIQNSNIHYPSPENFYSPDELFPEYPFQHLSNEPNNVYKVVRDCLAQAGLDKSNYGTPLWNPLGDSIAKGSNVFVLCNFVYHKRPFENQLDFFSKCTHGSVLRAVLDYVIIAVGESGKVSFGNASVQSCDWEKVLEETGAARVLEFYNKSDCRIVEACDLRSHIVKGNFWGGIKPLTKEESQCEIEIDLKKDSLLEDFYNSNKYPKFRSLDYGSNLTELYHGKNKHIYVLNRKILEADIVVSLLKLKTHEKVGVTLGIKGCVGSISHKHCLAHFRMGSPRNGGDEYQNGQCLNWMESRLGNIVDLKSTPFYTKYLRTVNFFLRKYIKKVIGRNIGGGWIGNDTTWRMSIDIARILKHVDKAGILKDEETRKMISFYDGIIGGEGQGPLSPTAKSCGYISYSDDLVSGDYIAACFMGMNPLKFPIISQAFSLLNYTLTSVKVEEIGAIFNGEKLDHNKLTSLKISPFKMPTGWTS